MSSLTDFVDPFHGNGTVDLPSPEGIAATWFFIKAQTGNTHPGACSPFGMVSAGAYSGAYPTGYGLNAPNTHGTPTKTFNSYTATGFSHFHQSGTGGIGTYYNYVRVTPLTKGLSELGSRWTLKNETAQPGYYATTLAETGIRAELTVSDKSAFHRYTFLDDNDASIAIDFSAGGLDFANSNTYPETGNVEIISNNEVQGSVVMEGVSIYVYVKNIGNDAEDCCLWIDSVEHPNTKILKNPTESHNSFGAVFKVSSKQATLVLGFSLRSTEQARANAVEKRTDSFNIVSNTTNSLWENSLNRILVEGENEQKTIFYSNLYHSLTKPADFSGESPYWLHDGPFYLDFATMWDQYKTQLPLMLTIYPDRGVDAINSILDLAEHIGWFPNSTILSTNFSGSLNQARGLAHFMIADAFHRKLSGIDWNRATTLMAKDILKSDNDDFVKNGLAHPITHNLDLAGASWCTLYMAESIGNNEIANQIRNLAGRWAEAYDHDTARLPDSANYYEGGAWNYSFRLLHDMAGRIGLYNTENDFIAELDTFFGYGEPSIEQPTDPGNNSYMNWGKSLNRFEGLNNEPDMEVPYAYIYAGRHDRTCEIVRSIMKYMFTSGRGGLPGNDDSGGTSSWYVWNSIGLFPVAGQPIMLIGSPIFRSSRILIQKQIFEISAKNTSKENIYVQEASLNGVSINRAYLHVDEVIEGGILSLKMGPTPGEWAKSTRPPSYPGSQIPASKT